MQNRIHINYFSRFTVPFMVIPPSHGMITPFKYAPSSEPRKHARCASCYYSYFVFLFHH